MATMARIATPARHTNVLTAHGRALEAHRSTPTPSASCKRAIDEYRRGLVPSSVPLTLLRHYVRLHKVEYLAGQTYLEAHPRELMLRNHV